MRPGPPPKPPELRLIQGNPGHRPIKTPVVKPTAGAECPKILTGAAREEWDRLYPELERLGLITQVDRASLAVYCLAWKALVWAEQQLEDDYTDTYETKTGSMTVQHPAFIVQTKAMEKIRQFSAEFGFTPASRARVHAPGSGDGEDEDDAFFGNPGPQPVPPARPRKKT